jgi:hypothetical protein
MKTINNSEGQGMQPFLRYPNILNYFTKILVLGGT